MTKYVLIDLDGTLLDFKSGEKEAFINTIKRLGYTPNDEDCNMFSKMNDHYFNEYKVGNLKRSEFHYERFKNILEYLKLSGDVIESNNFYVDNLKYQAQLFPDVIEILEYLSQKYDLYIASNGMTNVQNMRLKIAGIDKYFKKYYISEAIGANKPDVKFFDYIFNDINDLDKLKYIMIGDRVDDIAGGNNSLIKTIYLNRDNIQIDAIADIEIKSLIELKNIL